jgi:hypothetical protein
MELRHDEHFQRLYISPKSPFEKGGLGVVPGIYEGKHLLRFLIELFVSFIHANSHEYCHPAASNPGDTHRFPLSDNEYNLPNHLYSIIQSTFFPTVPAQNSVSLGTLNTIYSHGKRPVIYDISLQSPPYKMGCKEEKPGVAMEISFACEKK